MQRIHSIQYTHHTVQNSGCWRGREVVVVVVLSIVYGGYTYDTVQVFGCWGVIVKEASNVYSKDLPKMWQKENGEVFFGFSINL